MRGHIIENVPRHILTCVVTNKVDDAFLYLSNEIDVRILIDAMNVITGSSPSFFY